MIKGVASQKYISVDANKGSNAQNVVISTKSNLDGQLWKVTNMSDGYFTLTSKLGSFALDIANASGDNGANVQIYSSHAGDAQKFSVKTTSQNGAYAITTKASKGEKVLDVEQKRTNDGANICQYSSNGQTNQMWIFEAVSVSEQPSVAPTKEPVIEPTMEPTKTPDPVNPTTGKLAVNYTINNWGSGYQVSFKVENKSGAKVDNWTITIPKSQIKIDASWNITLKESGSNYVITPVSWNSIIENGNSVEFGVQGSGSINSTIDVTIK